METWLHSLVEDNITCWSCPLFDKLFRLISTATTASYDMLITIATTIFCVLIAFVVLYAFWKNMKNGFSDPFFTKSLRPLFINSIFAIAFLGLGITVPRFIGTITFEPVAQVTLLYTQGILNTDTATVNERVSYDPDPMSEDEIFTPKLRNTIIDIMKVTITEFQAYIHLGIAIISNTFSWQNLNIIKDIILFFIGLYLVYGFFKLFIKYCFCFVDVILAMALFAFFFPFALVFVVFRGADVPKWLKSLGTNLGTKQIKDIINAIVSLAANVITYTVILVIISKFFNDTGLSVTDLMNSITSGNILSSELSEDNMADMTIAGCIVLLYLITFLQQQIPQIQQMILSTFGLQDNSAAGKELADNMFKLTSIVINKGKQLGTVAINAIKDKTEGSSSKASGDAKGAAGATKK